MSMRRALLLVIMLLGLMLLAYCYHSGVRWYRIDGGWWTCRGPKQLCDEQMAVCRDNPSKCRGAGQ